MIGIFRVIKKFVVAAVLIYSFDVFAVSVNLSIPINFFTVLLVAFFDIPALCFLICYSVVL